MAEKYKNQSNILYEICNEPNGGTSWTQVKSYAEAVIKEIRAIDANAIILIGTPTWSQDADIAAKNPITGYQESDAGPSIFMRRRTRTQYPKEAGDGGQGGASGSSVSEVGVLLVRPPAMEALDQTEDRQSGSRC